MIVDCIADLHGHYPKLDGGDLLIVAGDMTARDHIDEYLKFNHWLSKQDYQRKIVIAGNHDNLCQKGVPVEVNPGQVMNSVPVLADKTTYLCDSGTEIVHYDKLDVKINNTIRRKELKVWGSPWTLQFPGMNPHCMAYTCKNEEELGQKFDLIPADTDILVCHSPMWGLHDTNLEGERCGSKSLLHHHVNHTLKNLKLFVCGHIHEGYGIYDIRHLQEMLGDPIGCVHVNASHVDVKYRPVNKPIRVIL